MSKNDRSLFAEIPKVFLFCLSILSIDKTLKKADIKEIGKRQYKGICTKVPADDPCYVFSEIRMLFSLSVGYFRKFYRK